MLARKLRTFFRFSPRQRRLTLSALGLVALARLGCWIVPFRRLQTASQHLGRARERVTETSPEEIVQAVRLASRYVPRATCLVQALATQVLLGRYGHIGEIHIGVALDPARQFRAHAWVESQGKVLIGGSEELTSYAPMLVLNGGAPKEARHT
jgi:hypothetical protein